MFDLRLPSGIFFVVTGVALVTMGLVEPDMRAPLSDVNVNLWSGLAILLFGCLLLLLARRKSGKNHVRNPPDKNTI